MQIVTTSNLYYDNNDLYDDGRTYDGNYPEDGSIDNPFIAGSNQARLITPNVSTITKAVLTPVATFVAITTTSTDQLTTQPLVEATTAIYPNNETNRYYKNKGQ